MKQSLLPFIVICLLFIQKSTAQTAQRCLATTLVPREMWLYNTEGVIAGNKDAVISKEYFHNKWVDLQSRVPFNKDEKFYCVFEAKDTQSYAYYFTGTKLSEGILRTIESWEKGGTLTFFVEETKGEIRKVSVIRFVLQ